VADTKKPQHHELDPGEDRFERTDARFSEIVWWMIAILVFIIILVVATYRYFEYSRRQVANSFSKPSPMVPKGQHAQVLTPEQYPLQLDPAADMKSFLKEEDRQLHSYSWVSKEAGVVSLPIDQAIDIALQPGKLKVRAVDPPTTETVPDDGADLPQDSSSGRTYWNVQR